MLESLFQYRHKKFDARSILIFMLKAQYVWMVSFIVGFPADSLIELLVTEFAFKAFILAVYPQVLVQILFPRKRLGTNITLEGFLACVYDSVLFEILFCRKLKATNSTNVIVICM